MKNKKSKNQQFAVIGLGRFGSTVAKTLFEKGEEVLAVDIKEEVITEAHEYTTHAVVADVTDERTLRALGIENFDVVIIGIASDLEASVLCTLTCKEIRRQKGHRKRPKTLNIKWFWNASARTRSSFPKWKWAKKWAHALPTPCCTT